MAVGMDFGLLCMAVGMYFGLQCMAVGTHLVFLLHDCDIDLSLFCMAVMDNLLLCLAVGTTSTMPKSYEFVAKTKQNHTLTQQLPCQSLMFLQSNNAEPLCFCNKCHAKAIHARNKHHVKL